MPNKPKSLYMCSECGNEFSKWYGKCPSCGAWNTIDEVPEHMIAPAEPAKGVRGPRAVKGAEYARLGDIEPGDDVRFSSGMEELDRVLGGGIVEGSLVLFGGEPGVGKSTMLLQICSNLAESKRILYVSGEESRRQLKMRAERIGVASQNLYICTSVDIDEILAACDSAQPELLIIDSIQTVYRSGQAGTPGSVGQVKECTMLLMNYAKSNGVTVFVVGHVNKEGAIAGPKVLEHIVDCVIYFEGEKNLAYRIVRSAKNRFGPTGEIGVFEMRSDGLAEVMNPSAALLDGRPENSPGTCVVCLMEGTRPVLAEIQALLAPTSFGNPRRMTSGADYNRTMLLLAVLEKRAGIVTGGCDSYINVIGGLRVSDSSADLATVLAIASSARDLPIGAHTAAIGEVGLTGELRAVQSLPMRLRECARLGFTTVIIPEQGTATLDTPAGIEVIRVKNIREAINFVM